MNIYILATLGMLLGVSLAGPPGPVTAIMVDRSIRSIPKGIAVGMGAMTADFILMILILIFGQATQISRFNEYIYVLGSLFFFYLAYSIWHAKETDISTKRETSGYAAGLTIGLVNPMQIGWWFTAGLSVFQKFGIMTMVFLFIGIVIWVLFLAILVFKAASIYGDRVKIGVKIFSITSLTFFGILFVYLAVTGLTSGF